jgi:hypothetical protein
VFHGELRDRIEERARDMGQEGLIVVDTQQLLRAACGVAFDRARMSAVYRYLRGVDPTTGDTDAAARRKMLDKLDDAAKECMEPMPWRDRLHLDLIQALDRHRRGHKQTVEVNHLHVHSGAQGMVGIVNAGERQGDAEK